MEIRELGLREARQYLGSLANYAHIAGDIAYLTRNGERIAAIVPLDRIKELAVTEPTTYTAAVGLHRSISMGDYCDVVVAKNKVVSYRENDLGDEIPVYEMSDWTVMEATKLDVRIDDDDVAGKAYEAADAELSAQGWRRTGDWDDAAGDAAYATVERA